VTPFGIFPQPVIHFQPSCSFFKVYDILIIMITTKRISRKNATNYYNISITKMHFKAFNFKRQLYFTNILNAIVASATVWPTSKFVVERLTVLIS